MIQTQYQPVSNTISINAMEIQPHEQSTQLINILPQQSNTQITQNVYNTSTITHPIPTINTQTNSQFFAHYQNSLPSPSLSSTSYNTIS